MKAFTVSRSYGVESGLPVEMMPYPHVPVGEEGRGRRLTRLGLGRQFLTGTTPKRVDGVDVIVTVKGTRLLVPEHGSGDERALVLIRVGGGFRGGSEIKPYPAVEKTYWPMVGTEPCPIPGIEGVTLVAQGWGAEGDAGRAGGSHMEALVIMQPGAVLRVVRWGRLYGGPAELLVRWHLGDLRFGSPDEVFPPEEEESEGGIVL